MVVNEGLVDKADPGSVCFWIWSFGVNMYRREELFSGEVPLSETPWAKALEHSRVAVLLLDEKVSALSDLWVIYGLLKAAESNKLMETAVVDVHVAYEAVLNTSIETAHASHARDRERLLDAALRYETPYGVGADAIRAYSRELLCDLLLRCVARRCAGGDVPKELLHAVGRKSMLPKVGRTLGELASLYGNVELLELCTSALAAEDVGIDVDNASAELAVDTSAQEPLGADPHSISVEDTSAVLAADTSAQGPTIADTQGPETEASDHADYMLDDSDDVQETVHELPPAVPVEVLEQLNIGVDFAQRLSILWAADLQWPEIINLVLRWPILLSLDLGIFFPDFSPILRAVGTWLWPLLLLLAVFIANSLHGNSGARWDVLFGHRWCRTMCTWLLVFVAVIAALGAPAALVADSREALLVALGQWSLVNLASMVVVLGARAQARRTKRAAQKHGLDVQVMMAGFHNFMRHSLCMILGLLFVASWLPPVRSCIDIAMLGGISKLHTFGLGVLTMLVSAAVFLLPSILLAVVTRGVKATVRGIPASWLIPIPISTLLAVLSIILFKYLVLEGDDFLIAAGFMLPWNSLMPILYILLALRIFRTHPFGALVAGDFSFQYHRIVSITSRILFAVSTAAGTVFSTTGSRAVNLAPGLVILFLSTLYIAVFRPYTSRIGNALDIASSAVLAIMLAVPLLPRSEAGDTCLACVPIVFFAAWFYSMRPRTTLRALWHSPERMRAKLQATIHSPEWIRAKPLVDLKQIAPQELLFWDVKHVVSLTDRLQAVLGSSEVAGSLPPSLSTLLRLCAAHAQDSEARLAAADAMADLGFGDATIRAAALQMRLEHLGKQLNSTDASIRCHAAQALGQIGDPAKEHSGALAASCKAKWEEEAVRVAAAQALGGIGPAAADHTRVLANLLVEKSVPIRDAAAEAIGKIGDAAFNQQKDLGLPEDHPFVRIASARAFSGQKKSKSKTTAISTSSKPKRHTDFD
eukprot:TRINITY_DN80040_c0_g1_i1.p1 TRINITY_DN80040_c0_g1~~TRINITY_DN80040_c0_g1_i1.p1  ORF type:complete len:1125 (-),score=191.35 TRINITY_DN80040_c0_g1_i1:130-3087(-)